MVAEDISAEGKEVMTTIEVPFPMRWAWLDQSIARKAIRKDIFVRIKRLIQITSYKKMFILQPLCLKHPKRSLPQPLPNLSSCHLQETNFPCRTCGWKGCWQKVNKNWAHGRIQIARAALQFIAVKMRLMLGSVWKYSLHSTYMLSKKQKALWLSWWGAKSV